MKSLANIELGVCYVNAPKRFVFIGHQEPIENFSYHLNSYVSDLVF